MEDFQEQEYEFLRRLGEEKVDRRTLVKRGLAAGAGLTVLSLSPAALAAVWDVVRTSRIGAARPASTLLGVEQLCYRGQLVEVEAVAVLG